MTQAPKITKQSWMMIGLLGLVWGSTFMVIELALRGITPFWLAAGRIGFASVLMLAFWAVTRKPLFTKSADMTPQNRDGRWGNLLVMSALSSAIPFVLLSWGQQHVTSGFAGVSMASVVLILLPLAHFFVTGERMTWMKSIGLIVGFIGVVILIGPQALRSSGAALETFGRLACLGAATCYAVSSILMRRLPPADPIVLATVSISIGAAMVIPVAWAVEGPPPMPDRETLFFIALLGLVPTAAANLLRVIVVRSAGPSFMSLVNYMVPLWSVFFGAVLLGEGLPKQLSFALVLILSGMALSQAHLLWRRRAG